MQYLIKVSGDVANKKCKAYVINSNSEEEAQEIAKQNFYNEFSADSEIVYIEPNKRIKKAILAFLFMIVPIFLSFINWKNGHDTISISPDYISTFYGVLIYSAFVVRFKGIPRTVSSWIDILFCIFNVLLFASFIKTLSVAKNISILGLDFSINTSIFLPITIILSWLGLKLVSLICMAIIGILALFKISILNIAMGSLWGPLYVICSFIGIMLYLSVEPAFIESIHQFSSFVIKSVKNLNKDISTIKSNIEKNKNDIK